MEAISFDDFFDFYKLQSIKEVFVENEFTSVLALLEVTESDLIEMGIKALGKRRGFSAAIKDYCKRSEERSKDKTKDCLLEESQNPLLESQEAVPGSQDDVPGSQDDVPGSQDDVPGSQEAVPGSQDDVPGSQDDVPGSQDDVPGSHEAVPGSQEDVQGSQDDVSGSQEAETNRESSSAGASFGSPTLMTATIPPSKVKQLLTAKSLKLYTQEQIAQACGVKKKKMMFLNKELCNLIRKSNVRQMTKAKIMGLALTAWHHFQAHETLIDVCSLETLISKLENYTGKTYSRKELSTINSNVDRLRKAQQSIQQTLKRIHCMRKSGSSKVDIDEQEVNLLKFHTELSKATDALRKSTSVKKSALLTLLACDDQQAVHGISQDVHVATEDIANEILGKEEEEGTVK